MMEEINALRSVLDKPGASDRGRDRRRQGVDQDRVLTNLAAKVDKLIIGGGMANTFLLARGRRASASRWPSPTSPRRPHEIMHAAKSAQLRDRAARRRGGGGQARGGRASTRRARCWRCLPDQMILDVGPKAVAHYADSSAAARRCSGTGRSAPSRSIPSARARSSWRARRRAATKAGKLTSVAGGGDTVAALNAAGVTDQFTYVSTAGGAFLEWLEGRTLPGIAALASNPFLGGAFCKNCGSTQIRFIVWYRH